MASDVSTAYDAPDSNAILPQPWRTPPSGWDRQHQNELQEKVEQFPGPWDGVEGDTFNVLLIGQIGMGKTSLSNTINSVLRGEYMPLGHTAEDDSSVTTRLGHYTLETFGRRLPIKFIDLRGYEIPDDRDYVPAASPARPARFSPSISDVKLILAGRLDHDYEFQPDTVKYGSPHYLDEGNAKNKIHALVIVTDVGKTTKAEIEVFDQLKEVQKEAQKLKIKQLVVVNKVDKIPGISEDVTKLFLSERMMNIVGDLANLFGVSKDDVLLQRNCTEKKQLSPDVGCLTLHNLLHILKVAELTLQCQHGSRPMPPRKLMDTEWRKNINISEKSKKEAVTNLAQVTTPVNIVLMGLQGGGKTELVNSVETALEGDLIRRNRTGVGERPITTKMTHHPLATEQGDLNVTLVDTTGLSTQESAGMHPKDVSKTQRGQIPDGYGYNPLEPCHATEAAYPVQVVAFVVNGKEFKNLPQRELDLLKEAVKSSEENRDQVRAIFLTHMDEQCAHVQKDVSAMFRSQEVEDCVKDVNKKLGVQITDILPVVCYTSRDSHESSAKSSLLLTSLVHLCQRAKSFSSARTPPPQQEQASGNGGGGWGSWLWGGKK